MKIKLTEQEKDTLDIVADVVSFVRSKNYEKYYSEQGLNYIYNTLIEIILKKQGWYDEEAEYTVRYDLVNKKLKVRNGA